jgi:hypothetical protein
MIKVLSHKYMYASLVFLWINILSTRVAWVHVDSVIAALEISLFYGSFFLVIGIIAAHLFPAIGRRHPIKFSVVGMFVGICTSMVVFSWLFSFDVSILSSLLGMRLYNACIYIPALLIAIAIGFPFKGRGSK